MHVDLNLNRDGMKERKFLGQLFTSNGSTNEQANS